MIVLREENASLGERIKTSLAERIKASLVERSKPWNVYEEKM